MIEPTIGRVVWYYAAGADHEKVKPQAALIANINEDGTLTVGGFDHDGRPFSDHGVPLVQDDGYGNPGGGSWACWMPYQKGQAAKTEALEAQIKGAP